MQTLGLPVRQGPPGVVSGGVTTDYRRLQAESRSQLGAYFNKPDDRTDDENGLNQSSSVRSDWILDIF